MVLWFLWSDQGSAEASPSPVGGFLVGVAPPVALQKKRRPAGSPMMKVELAYGQGYLTVDLPKGRTVVIAPSPTVGLKDERAAVIQALEQPIGSKPLKADTSMNNVERGR